ATPLKDPYIALAPKEMAPYFQGTPCKHISVNCLAEAIGFVSDFYFTGQVQTVLYFMDQSDCFDEFALNSITTVVNTMSRYNFDFSVVPPPPVENIPKYDE